MAKNFVWAVLSSVRSNPNIRSQCSPLLLQKRCFSGDDQSTGYGHSGNILRILAQKEKKDSVSNGIRAVTSSTLDIHPDRKNDVTKEVEIHFFDIKPIRGVLTTTTFNQGVQLKLLDIEIPEMQSLSNEGIIRFLEEDLQKGRFSVYPQKRVITASSLQLEHIDAANCFEYDVLESARGYFKKDGAELQNISCQEYYPRPRTDTRVNDLMPYIATLSLAGFSQMKVVQYQKSRGAVHSTLEEEVDKIKQSHQGRVLLSDGVDHGIRSL